MSNTLFVGKVYLRFDELLSTNDYAREISAKSTPAEGTVVRADRQSAGRGQFGSHWESEPGQNLTLSVIFRPTFLPVSEQFRLSEAVALAVLDTVDGGRWTESGLRPPSTIHHPPSTVKWPNDIYLGDRKVAGILIQNSLAGVHLQTAVVGIGLNVNQTVFRSDAPNPTSLALAAGHPFDLDELAEQLFKNLEIRYLQLKNPASRSALQTEYREHLYRLGESARFQKTATGEECTGIIRGVAADGRLAVDCPEPQFFSLREIRFLL